MEPAYYQRDIRGSAEYAVVARYADEWYRPATATIADAADIAVAPHARLLAFTGTIVDGPDKAPTTRVCIVDAFVGGLKAVTTGPNNDRLPKWCPQGECIAYLSDRDAPGHFQLYLLDPHNMRTSRTEVPDGSVEYLHWSPRGDAILLGVAGTGADSPGAQGGIKAVGPQESGASWMPEVDTESQETLWRSIWILHVESGKLRRVSLRGWNIWEAVWLGEESMVAVCSRAPDEGAWYGAALCRIDVASGSVTQIYQPSDQLGWLSASPNGKRIAFVEAVSSDRLLVAGDLLVIDDGGQPRRIEVNDIDVTFTEWQSDSRLLIAGMRSFETVVAVIDIAKGSVRELMAAPDLTCGERYPTVAAAPGDNEAVFLVLEGYLRSPSLMALKAGASRELLTFVSDELAAHASRLCEVTRLSWCGRDQVEIQGQLLRPRRQGTLPIIMMIHGGPVWQWRPRFLGRPPLFARALLEVGYALFLPEPRGSSGRGRAYAARVRGDMAGEDAHDCLAGLDQLLKDQAGYDGRVGTMGVSYGGFLSSWLITQDHRFSAAVAISPVTDWISEELTSHIAAFCREFLGEDLRNSARKHILRSPVRFAHQCRTPTLIACGALDRNTPPGQGLEFYRALLANSCDSVLLTYPREGHGCRQLPAHLDLTARVLQWFSRYIPATIKAT